MAQQAEPSYRGIAGTGGRDHGGNRRPGPYVYIILHNNTKNVKHRAPIAERQSGVTFQHTCKPGTRGLSKQWEMSLSGACMAG